MKGGGTTLDIIYQSLVILSCINLILISIIRLYIIYTKQDIS